MRTGPVFIGLQKTRLLDPTINFYGTNDHPGDYRGSGCTACHVVYANDRSPVHSGVWAQYGNRGKTATTASIRCWTDHQQHDAAGTLNPPQLAISCSRCR